MTYLLDFCGLGLTTSSGFSHVVFILPVTLPARHTIAYCQVLTARV
jgi:hypothetical protein